MHVLFRRAEMPRDVASLEASVDDVREARRVREHTRSEALDQPVAACAAARAEVQVGQPPGKEAWYFRQDRVTVEEHRVTVAVADARDLGGEALVIRVEESRAPRQDLR